MLRSCRLSKTCSVLHVLKVKDWGECPAAAPSSHPTHQAAPCTKASKDTKTFEDFFLPSHMIYCNRTHKQGCTDADLDLEKRCSKKLHQREAKQAVQQRDAHPASWGCPALLSRLCGFLLFLQVLRCTDPSMHNQQSTADHHHELPGTGSLCEVLVSSDTCSCAPPASTYSQGPTTA